MTEQFIRILVAEDEKPVLENILELLNAEGYAVDGARDGEEAYRKILQRPPDLIVCDIRMPRLDGYGLLSRLSQQGELASIPFIFLTALTERADLRNAMVLGADDFISKPFSRRDLLDAIARRLSKKANIVNQTRLESSALSEQVAWNLPYDLHATSQKINLLANQIEQSATEDPAIIRAARGIRFLSSRLTQAVENSLILLETLSAGKEKAAPSFDPIQLLSLKKAIEEITQAITWQFERDSDLLQNLQDGAVRISERYVHKIIEEILISALSRTATGERIIITGVSDKERKTYSIRVEDHGLGFPGEHGRELILQNPELDEVLKIGIGLAAARALVQRCHGRFTLISEPVKGNAVIVELPME